MVALSRNVARKHALEMLLTGDAASADDAYRIGLAPLDILPLAQPSLASSSVGSTFPLDTAMDHMIKIELTPSEATALKELAAAGPRGRKSRAVRHDLARLIRAHYVTEQSASIDTVVYVITDYGRRALAN